MQEKSTNREIIKYLSTYFIFIFSTVEFIRTFDFRFIIIGLVLLLTFIYYLTKDIHNKRTEEQVLSDMKQEIKKMEEELDCLHELSKIIMSTFDVKTITEYTYNVLIRITGCEWYHVCFVNNKTFSSAVSYEYGNRNPDNIWRMNYEEYIKDLIEKGSEEETEVKILSDKIKGDIITIPLNVSNELTGVIYIGSSKCGAFSGVNLSFLKSLAYYAAISIRNAEMFNNIFIQKQEIEALYEQAAASNEELNSYIMELDETKEELNKKNDELTKLFDEIQFGYLQTVMSLANSIEAKDAYTRGHCQRVMEISCELARAIGLTEDQIEDLRYAAILHDIGKIGIGANILNKQGKLTDEEFDEIKKHPLIAYNILKDIEFLRNGINGILQHHERYDGRGYPHGLRGEEICIFARIMCVADAFDAMTSDRPYRKGMDMEVALNELQRCKGTQFDPEVVNLMVSMADSGKNTDEMM